MKTPHAPDLVGHEVRYVRRGDTYAMLYYTCDDAQ